MTVAPSKRRGELPQLYALTIWQPWCSAIVDGSKRIENRGWRPPEWIIGDRIWLHAGKRFDLPGSLRCATLGFDRAKADLPLGAIIGSARVAGYQTAQMPKAKLFSKEGYLYEGADLRGDPWWVGPVGWVLEDVLPLEPHAALGMQKLWVWPHGAGP